MENKIIDQLAELRKKVDSLPTKDNLKTFEKEVEKNLDKHSDILKRLDQDRVETLKLLKRIEADIENVKRHLHLA